MNRSSLVVTLLLATSLAACSTPEAADSGVDAAATDASVIDASAIDAPGMDAGGGADTRIEPTADAWVEPGTDATLDATIVADAPLDPATDAWVEPGTDANLDAASVQDAPVDAGADAGMMSGVMPRTWADPVCAPHPSSPCPVGNPAVRVFDASAIGADPEAIIENAFSTTVTTVCLRAGTYLVDRPIVLRRDGVTLRGEGDATILQLAAGSYPIDPRCAGVHELAGEPVPGSTRLPNLNCRLGAGARTRVGMVTLRADNVRIADMTFDQNYRALQVGGDTVPNPVPTMEEPRLAVLPRASSIAVATRADLDGMGAPTAGVARTSGATIDNVFFLDTYGDAVGAIAANADNLSVRNSRFVSAYVTACDSRYDGLGARDCWPNAGPHGEQFASAQADGFVIENNCVDGALDDAIALHGGTDARIENNLIWTTGGRILIEGALLEGASCTSEAACPTIVRNNYIEYIESGGTGIWVTVGDQSVRPEGVSGVVIQGNEILINTSARYGGAPVQVEQGITLFGAGQDVRVLDNRIEHRGSSGTSDCARTVPPPNCGRDFDAIMVSPRTTNSGLTFAAGNLIIARNRVWDRALDSYSYGFREAASESYSVVVATEETSGDDLAACSIEFRDNVFETDVLARGHFGSGTTPSRIVSGNTCSTCSIGVQTTGLSVAGAGCGRIGDSGFRTTIGCRLTEALCPSDGLEYSVRPAIPDCITLTSPTPVPDLTATTISPFVFYGSPQASVWVSRDRGVLSFSPMTTLPGSASLPNTAAPNHMLAPFSAQFPLRGASVVTAVATVGTATVRVFEWRDAEVRVSTASPAVYTPPVTFQVQLWPAGVAEFHYCTAPTGPHANVMSGANSYIGFENATGTSGQTMGNRASDSARPGRFYRISNAIP